MLHVQMPIAEDGAALSQWFPSDFPAMSGVLAFRARSRSRYASYYVLHHVRVFRVRRSLLKSIDHFAKRFAQYATLEKAALSDMAVVAARSAHNLRK